MIPTRRMDAAEALRLVTVFAVIAALYSLAGALAGCGDGDGSPPTPRDLPTHDEYGYPYRPLSESPILVTNPRTAVVNGYCDFFAEVVNPTAVTVLVTVVAEVFDGARWTGQGDGGTNLLAPGQTLAVSGDVIDEQTPERLYPYSCGQWNRAAVSYISLDGGKGGVFVDFEVLAKIGDPYEKIGNHGFGENGEHEPSGY